MSLQNKPLRDPAWHERLFSTGILLAVIIACSVVTEFKPWALLDESSLRATRQFLASFFPPAHYAEFLKLIAISTWQTIAVATAGVTLH